MGEWSMRQQLVRSTILAVVAAVVVVGLPVYAYIAWLVLTEDQQIERWFGMQPIQQVTEVTVRLGLVTIAGIAVTGLFNALLVRRYAKAMDELVAAAEQLGEGRSKIEPTRTGIPEVDQVSEVLARGAQRVRVSLASERDFASDASHQLRTPLTALLMRLEEISVIDDLDAVHEEAGIAIDQVERLTTVVDDLLMRSRRIGEAPIPAVSLDSVLASLQREWQPAFENARRSVRVHGERGLHVKATPVALSQVLSTLLENSLVHGRGTVDVHARRSGPSVIVEVKDQGDGIEASMAPHIFERSVSSGRGNSTGLGLALARDLAESNGGRLDLVASRPATFALFLSEGARD